MALARVQATGKESSAAAWDRDLRDPVSRRRPTVGNASAGAGHHSHSGTGVRATGLQPTITATRYTRAERRSTAAIGDRPCRVRFTLCSGRRPSPALSLTVSAARCHGSAGLMPASRDRSEPSARRAGPSTEPLDGRWREFGHDRHRGDAVFTGGRPSLVYRDVDRRRGDAVNAIDSRSRSAAGAAPPLDAGGGTSDGCQATAARFDSRS